MRAGIHINSIHMIYSSKCVFIAVGHLSGRTFNDYEHHIDDDLSNIARVFVTINSIENENNIKQKLIGNI